jgi:hypothetical protein
MKREKALINNRARLLSCRFVQINQHLLGTMAIKSRTYFRPPKDEGEVIATFGEARLIKYLNCEYELRGGSKEDRLAAKEWIALFCHEVVVHET